MPVPSPRYGSVYGSDEGSQSSSASQSSVSPHSTCSGVPPMIWPVHHPLCIETVWLPHRHQMLPFSSFLLHGPLVYPEQPSSSLQLPSQLNCVTPPWLIRNKRQHPATGSKRPAKAAISPKQAPTVLIGECKRYEDSPSGEQTQECCSQSREVGKKKPGYHNLESSTRIVDRRGDCVALTVFA